MALSRSSAGEKEGTIGYSTLMFSNYDSWKTTPPDLDECDREFEGEDEPTCPPTLPTGMSPEAFATVPATGR